MQDIRISVAEIEPKFLPLASEECKDIEITDYDGKMCILFAEQLLNCVKYKITVWLLLQ